MTSLRMRSCASVLKLLLVGYSIACSGLSHAATQGDRDTTSTGSTDVSLSISSLVRITGMNDLAFGTYSGSGQMARDDDVCVWTNQDSGNYKVTARGDGAAFAFVVNNGSGTTIPYAVKWNATTGTSGNSTLSANIQSGALSGAGTGSSTCGGGSTANFQVIFSESALLDTIPGVYTGVLTFVVAP